MRANLGHANLSDANLSDANLSDAHLSYAYLTFVNLSLANLHGAYLRGADLSNSDLSGANLSGANLTYANLNDANLNGANLEKAKLMRTSFGDVDLTGVTGLERCIHYASCTIDHRTLQKSGPLPLAFLRGVGLPDNLIEYLPSIFNQAVQHFSCFISYSSKDDEFAHRIHADLQKAPARMLGLTGSAM
jgi:hypothetical protein